MAAASVNPIVLPGKQQLKSLNRSPKFLRHGYNVKGNAAKRKSAVELLQESKAFYVKSEQVLDSKQELKHTEHLQVSSNSSYDTLLRHPIRTSGGQQQQQQHGVHGEHSADPTTLTVTMSPVTSMTVQRVPDPQTHVVSQHQRSASHGVESKFLTVTLLGSAQLHNHKSGVHAVSEIVPTRHRAVITRVAGTTTNVTSTRASVGSSNPSHHRTVLSESYVQQPKTSTPTNRSPRPPHVRSKTQPESNACPPSSAFLTAQYRRSLSERDNVHPSSDDIQMKLRRLLNTDSKENLSVSNGNSDGPVVDRKNTQNDRCRQTGNSEIVDAASTAFIKPRHQQEGNYCIHKSMPDLSPLQLGQQSQRRRSNDSNDSMSVKAPKSADIKPPSWTTSDYVSRSPSSRHKPCFPSGRPMDKDGHGYVDVCTRLHQKEQQLPVSSRCPVRNERNSLDEDGDEVDADDDDDDVAGAEMIGNLVTPGVHRRPIFRSKSDISHRYSKSGTDLSSTGSPSKRGSRYGVELERFFDTMGLDSSVLYVLSTPTSEQCSSPVFFASVSTSPSSNSSSAGKCCCNGNVGTGSEVDGDRAMNRPCQNGDEGNSKDGLNNVSLMQHGPVETSIVERNARVIKWLFNCRKVSQGSMRASSALVGWMKSQDP